MCPVSQPSFGRDLHPAGLLRHLLLRPGTAGQGQQRVRIGLRSGQENHRPTAAGWPGDQGAEIREGPGAGGRQVPTSDDARPRPAQRGQPGLCPHQRQPAVGPAAGPWTRPSRPPRSPGQPAIPPGPLRTPAAGIHGQEIRHPPPAPRDHPQQNLPAFEPPACRGQGGRCPRGSIPSRPAQTALARTTRLEPDGCHRQSTADAQRKGPRERTVRRLQLHQRQGRETAGDGGRDDGTVQLDGRQSAG